MIINQTMLKVLSRIEENNQHGQFVRFFETDSDFVKNINIILIESDLKFKYDCCYGFARIIFLAESTRTHKNSAVFQPSNLQLAYQELIYLINSFGHWGVPFKEWSDIAGEGLKVLAYLIEIGKLKSYHDDDRVEQLSKRIRDRRNELLKQEKYAYLWDPTGY